MRSAVPQLQHGQCAELVYSLAEPDRGWLGELPALETSSQLRSVVMADHTFRRRAEGSVVVPMADQRVGPVRDRDVRSLCRG